MSMTFISRSPLAMSYGSSPSTTAGQPQCLPFFGIIDNTIHAFRLVLAAKNGLVPRIVRRLTQSERTRMIISGAVFVFSVKESGMKRWRDGLFWSASRIDGNFLVSYNMIRSPILCSTFCRFTKR